MDSLRMIISPTFLTLFFVVFLVERNCKLASSSKHFRSSEEYDDYSDSDLEDYESGSYEESVEDKKQSEEKDNVVSSEIKERLTEDVGCGIARNSYVHLRIIGGEGGRRGMWPWQVSLTKSGSHDCGGALIKSQWILTAAHCFLKETTKTIRENWVARLGVNKLQEKELDAKNITIEDVYPYPGYVLDGFLHDIALVKLSRPVLNLWTNNFINTVCLPKHANAKYEGKHCVATGWGLTGFSNDAEPVYPNDLQRVVLDVVKQTECHKFFHMLGYNRHQLCAGSSGKTACYGDSGGPFVCQENKGHWTLVGVNSYGRGGSLVKCKENKQRCVEGKCYDYCVNGVYRCHDQLPTVFTRTASYLDWIQTVIREH